MRGNPTIEPARLAFEDLRRKVIGAGLCTHCGTCVGCCPVDAISVGDVLSTCIPQLVDNCISCGLCSQVCPGLHFDFSEDGYQAPNAEHDPLVGPYRKFFVGHASDLDLRYQGASGGVVTAFLTQLLEQAIVDGAVVLDFSQDRRWEPKIRLATRRSEILAASQSKYFIYPQNAAIKKLKESSLTRVAYVALPCQIRGLRKAIQQKVAGTEKIKVVVGLYCGNNLYYDATASLYKRFGIRDLNSIHRIAYREGPHPGSFVVFKKDGGSHAVDKFTFNYLSFFYTPLRCLFCTDQTSELSDISVGDAWRGVFRESESKGDSVVIVRDPELLKLIDSGGSKSFYKLEEKGRNESIRMHANVLDNKKTGAPVRMRIWRWAGKEIPVYKGDGQRTPLKRYFYEAGNLVLILLCAKGFSRRLVNKVPLFLLRPLLTFVRGTWRKRSAKNIKNI